MPELIDDGVSGLLVAADDLDAATNAVGHVGQLERAAVRAQVAAHFTAERMVDDYLHLYRRLLGRPQESLARPRHKRPDGARCDACHTRRAKVRRSRDELLTVCSGCARGVDIAALTVDAAISNVVSRAPATERRALKRRLAARQALHAARRERFSGR